MPDTFDPLSFLDLAHRLASEPKDVNLRAAVGRAYYAIFLVARDKANIRGKEEIHGRTKSAIQTKSFTAGSQFETLRQMRVHADYLLKPDDANYNPDYDDWDDNWKNADHLTSVSAGVSKNVALKRLRGDLRADKNAQTVAAK